MHDEFIMFMVFFFLSIEIIFLLSLYRRHNRQLRIWEPMTGKKKNPYYSGASQPIGELFE